MKCAEQSLEPNETCCLSEIFLPNIESNAELLDVTELLYRISKHSLDLDCHLPETLAVVKKNRRMGIGATGILQASEEQVGWLDEAYNYLREFDLQYSYDHNWPPSIKLTTVKPSGTLSLLPGVTPGIHPAYAQYMIRRIRMAASHELVELCRKSGYTIEFVKNFDGTLDRNTVCVEFPFAYPEGTVLASEMTALKQLEWVCKLQTLWSDNSVSCTVYYRKEELPEIQEYLAKNYSTKHKSLSFLLHNDHGFAQAPYEEITKERYDELIANTTPITGFSEALELSTSDECAGGACPIR
jgi:ribonucleoside-triphosphate reductase